MTKKLLLFGLVVLLLLGTASAAGGMPAAHGVDGKTFGYLVSNLAKSEPGAVADHVTACKDTSKTNMAGGMPAAHGVDGKTFGYLVSNLAKSEPGAVADHVTACN